MNSSGDFNIQNFQSLIENYETALKDVTQELDSVQSEQSTIKKALNQYEKQNLELNKILTERSAKCEAEHKYHESDLVGNLKAQLKIVGEEKDLAIRLWQNAAEAVDQLESELKLYKENSHGLIPKLKFIQLKNSYEEKLNDLQATVTETKNKLEETINLKSKELQTKDKEITGSLQSHNNTFQIVRNLEEEVLHLQQRLNDANEHKRHMERDTKHKSMEIQALRIKVQDSRQKVEEALQCVEAALAEKDAALMREAKARDEAEKMSQTLEEFIKETDSKIKEIQHEHKTKMEQLRLALETTNELVKVKENELEISTKKCGVLEEELEKRQNGRILTEESVATKMLSLEKNLENTFQKLLLSEKHNIQLKAELDSVKNDLEQMSHLYERDVNTRETEKTVLKNEIKKLQTELDASHLKITESRKVVEVLKEQMSAMEVEYQKQIKESESNLQQTNTQRQELETVHNRVIQELKEQLISQTEINKKWRAETKNITEEMEKIITVLKGANSKVKHENKLLNERLKEANIKMLEYRKFLEMISHDVSRITSITLPETVGESVT